MRRVIEQANSFVIGICDDGNCQRVHVELLDRDGQTFATMVIGFDRIVGVVETLRDCAYRIITLRGDKS